MNKSQVKRKVADLLYSGVGRSETFTRLSGQGIKDSQLASFIASYTIPSVCKQHRAKVRVLIGIMFVQAVIALLLGFGLESKIGPNARWIVAGFPAAIALLFAWGFYKNLAGAYNMYILLSVFDMPRQLAGLTSSPVGTAVGVAIAVGLAAFVWYLRSKLFPDLLFISLRKVEGSYVFSS